MSSLGRGFKTFCPVQKRNFSFNKQYLIYTPCKSFLYSPLVMWIFSLYGPWMEYLLTWLVCVIYLFFKSTSANSKNKFTWFFYYYFFLISMWHFFLVYFFHFFNIYFYCKETNQKPLMLPRGKYDFFILDSKILKHLNPLHKLILILRKILNHGTNVPFIYNIYLSNIYYIITYFLTFIFIFHSLKILSIFIKIQ